ncbi:hypothetical protein GCM10022393_00580 [Aquimarina addita]|uniref:Uncharacterized protein n=1 Tax=Aquimarina addita TaxID=870485 RepID=A0ABP7X741_9FLAO
MPSEHCDCNFYVEYTETTINLQGLSNALRAARLRELEDIFEKEIEDRLNEDYDNFDDAALGLFNETYSEFRSKIGIKTVRNNYISNYREIRNRLSTVFPEAQVLNIRKNELSSSSSKLGYLKLDDDTYLRDLTSTSQVNDKLNIVNDKLDDLNDSYAFPHKIITGLSILEKDDSSLREAIAQSYLNHFDSHGNFEDKIRLMQAYLIERGRVGPTLGVYDPPILNTDGSTQAYNEALAVGSNESYSPDYTDKEAIELFAINSLGETTANYLNVNINLKDEVLSYIGSTTYDKPEMNCTYFLFDTYFSGEQFNTIPSFYDPDGINFKQNAFNPNLAVSFKLTPNALDEGFEGFGNVLYEFFKNPNVRKDYKGKIISDIFFRNNINRSPSITDEQIGTLFEFTRTESRDRMYIKFANNIGSSLYPNGIAIGNILLGNEDFELAMLMAQGNQELNDFLDANNYSEDSVLFAKEAVEVLNNGGEVDFFSRVIKDLSFSSSKANCVYEKLESRSDSFKNIINNFKSPDPVSLDLLFTVSPIPNDAFGNEINGQTYVPNQNGVIKITLNETNLDERTELGLARTIIHEAIHADMHRHLIAILNNGITFDNLTSTQLNELTESNRFPELFDAINLYGLNYYQHELMTQRYLGVIAEALKDYDNASRSDGFYIDIAWEGLQRTTKFRELDSDEQSRLQNEWKKFMITDKKNCD